MRFIKKVFPSLLFFVLALSMLPTPAQAQTNGLVMDIEAGWDGNYKEKTWTPVTIRLENNGQGIKGELEITLDNYIQPQVTYRYPLDLPSVSRKEITLFVYPETSTRAVIVTLVSGRKVLGKAEASLRSMSSTDPLFGVIAASPSAFNILSDLDNLAELSGIAVVAQLDLDSLPDRSTALDAINILVISSVDTAALSSTQVQALGEWVAAGGRLVVTGGPAWQKTVNGLAAAPFLPLVPDGDRTIPNLNSLQSFAESDSPLPDTDRGLVVAVGELQPGARVLAGEVVNGGQVPLVARLDYGSGAAYYLAFDPALQPFENWDAGGEFFRQLLEMPVNKPSWSSGFTDWWTANTAAQSVPDIRLPSFLIVCGLLILYIAILGPLNFILLRMVKRRELGWISLPVTVVIFSVLVFVIGTVVRAGGPLISRLSLVQVWPGVETARVNSLVSLYSPNRRTYTLIAPPPSLVHRVPTDPPNPAQNLTFWQDGGQIKIEGLRLDSGSLAPLVVESSSQAPRFSSNLELVIDGAQVYLTGQITNQSELKLDTAVIHTPAGSFALGELAPAQTVPVEFSLATQQIVGAPQPVLPYNPTVMSPIRGGGPDQFISQVIGTSNYYDDQETYRRWQMLLAAMGGYSTMGANVSGIYLTGWTNDSPYTLELEGEKYRSRDTTLYIVQLSPRLSLASGSILLPSGIFARRTIESTVYAAPPYYIYTGQYFSFEDTPVMPIAFSKATRLNIELLSSQSTGSAKELAVSLWNYSTNEWEPLADLSWGMNSIEDPGNFVSPQGAVRLRCESISPQGIQVDGIAISLVIDH